MLVLSRLASVLIACFFFFADISFKMECSLASNSSVSAANCISSVKSDKTVKTGLRVNFTEKGEVKERREKFLTAKYGSHQMNLIRKRLAVEMWLYEELQKLSTAAVSRTDYMYSTSFFVESKDYRSEEWEYSYKWDLLRKRF